MDTAKLLVVEDDPLFGEIITNVLKSNGYRVRLARNGAEALETVSEESFDILLQDVKLPDANGLDVMSELLNKHKECRALVMTGHGSISTAVEAMKRGAFDFLTKPFPVEVLLMKLRTVLDFSKMASEIASLRDLGGNAELGVCASPAMKKVVEMALAVAPTDATLLLLGESGTGKDFLADFVHKRSRRSGRPFIKVNCAAIPDTLLESELFGVERGAFTGADKSRAGYLEQAAGGTLFLDEIGDVPLPLQGKFLRVLEERSVMRVGGSKAHPTDFRLIAATNRNLQEMASENSFRSDLFFRINIIPLTLPPLRERREDIPPLIAFFRQNLRRKGIEAGLQLAPEAMEAICRYRFPGNVRELKNLIEHLMLLYPGETIKPRHLPESLLDAVGLGNLFESFPVGRPLKEAVAEFERKYIDKVLKSVDGRKSQAAAILGLSRKALWEKLKP